MQTQCVTCTTSCPQHWYCAAESLQYGHQKVFLIACQSSVIELCVSVSVRPTGGRLSRGDGEGLSSADLPSQPPLSVEETGPAQEETSGLVSVSVSLCVCVCVCGCGTVFVNISVCHQCVIICCLFGCHGKIHWCLCLFISSPSHGHSWRWNQFLLRHLQCLSLPFFVPSYCQIVPIFMRTLLPKLFFYLYDFVWISVWHSAPVAQLNAARRACIWSFLCGCNFHSLCIAAVSVLSIFLFAPAVCRKLLLKHCSLMKMEILDGSEIYSSVCKSAMKGKYKQLIHMFIQLCQVKPAKNHIQAFESCSQIFPVCKTLHLTCSSNLKASASLIKCIIFPGVKYNIDKSSTSVNQWRKQLWLMVLLMRILFFCSLVHIIQWCCLIELVCMITWNISKQKE